MKTVSSSTWRLQALCAQVDPELWFAQAGSDEADEAKRICKRCPVRRECGDHAVTCGEEYGIWAGRERGTKRSRARAA